MLKISDLLDIQRRAREDIKHRFPDAKGVDLAPMQKTEILVCGSRGCDTCGSTILNNNLNKILKAKNLSHLARANQVGCFSLCVEGPIILFMPQNIIYTRVQPEEAERIVDEHIVGGKLLEDHLHRNSDGSFAKKFEDVDFFREQQYLIKQDLRIISPTSINDYIALGGYFNIHKVLTSMTQEDVISTISDSGLRGRGGAGFPTGKKWKFAQIEKAKQKYVICNADEGDPGAFMNRTVLESNPHVIIEGMAIGGYAVGATKGVVYIRAEYDFAVDRLKKAIKDAKKLGVIGKNIFGTGFDFDIEISLGAGAFVCGEETALIASVEGRRGEPVMRPPYPAKSGLYGCPTVINNVETWANVPKIIEKGADWFCQFGSEASKGTKVFAVSGKIKNTGLVEMPIGTPLRKIVYDVCGGVPNNKKFKAAQVGGPSGGCVPAQHIDTPVDYNTLNSIGSMMGSGGIIVVDEDTCMVDLSKFFLEFTCNESCGKCTPCRIGNQRLLELLTKITEGKGEIEDLQKLEELSEHIKSTSLCGLGQSSPNPILSTIRFFKDEYIAHIIEKRCPAKVCKSLIKYHIGDNCIGCGLCKRDCPVSCISGEIRQKHIINDDECIRCGLCAQRCPVNVITREDRYGKH